MNREEVEVYGADYVSLESKSLIGESRTCVEASEDCERIRKRTSASIRKEM